MTVIQFRLSPTHTDFSFADTKKNHLLKYLEIILFLAREEYTSYALTILCVENQQRQWTSCLDPPRKICVCLLLYYGIEDTISRDDFRDWIDCKSILG